jgi:hypothetical protein
MLIEDETGTYTGETHSRHGYGVPDFKDVPFTRTKLYPPFMTMPTFPQR